MIRSFVKMIRNFGTETCIFFRQIENSMGPQHIINTNYTRKVYHFFIINTRSRVCIHSTPRRDTKINRIRIIRNVYYWIYVFANTIIFKNNEWSVNFFKCIKMRMRTCSKSILILCCWNPNYSFKPKLIKHRLHSFFSFSI